MLIFENKPSNMTLPITEHFRLAEYRCKCRKCKLTFIHPLLAEYTEILRRLWNAPIISNSAYRCQEHNRSRSVGGSEFSYHMRGMAHDLRFPHGGDKRNEFIYLCKKIFPYTKLYVGERFIHCDVRDLS